MGLIACKVCKKEISSGAYACAGCGATQRMHRGWWFVIVPAGLFLLFIGYGYSIPEHVETENRVRAICEQMIGGAGGPRQYECDRLYHDELAKGRDSSK